MWKSWWTAYFKCVETSEGWGKCGDTQRISNICAWTRKGAHKHADTLRPGNWRTIRVVRQPNRFH